VVRNELQTGISSMLGTPFPELPDHPSTVNLLVGLGGSCQELSSGAIVSALKKVGTEGYLLKMVRQSGKQLLVIAANSEKGLLYGTYRLLLQIKCGTDLNGLSIRSAPKIKVRILNHWDNLNGSIERGYAGQSLWKWSELPDKKDARYTDYARANASIGINATVLNNVNANPEMLTPPYLKKVAALADLFRPYGIKVFLSVKFSSPINIGGMGTADPLDPAVRQWWKQKVTEVYSYIPDFGGFLVKANSEGQPGPQNYHRSHADGANMLAEALQPFGGIVMWRAFVYDNNVPDDRAKQALNEFKPLDGKFAANVLVQVKNGAIDFQPREPFHPMFGMMPKTPLMMEFQITQEYLGQSTDLCYLAPLYRECLESDTYARGKHSTVSKVIDGSLEHHALTGIAGVANTGDDRNWTGHLFGQANWYAFGRLAWNPEESSEGIASDWIRLTLSMEPEVVSTIQKIMMGSRENGVNYMTPLGLHHIMGYNHHFGPAPWVNRGRADWTCIYYHKADSAGIGFDRSPTGSNATGQYAPKVGRRFADPSTCPEKYLLWFHHLPWNYQMKSGRTLWDELNLHYADGVAAVGRMGSEWQSLRGKIDPDLFAQVALKLEKQEKLARWWRNSCVLYFQQYARMPIPEGVPQPDQTLEECKKFDFKELK
ncbi:MAG: alpha-glucuronidase, partial [Marinilabiliales bacterium]|nr:alpha-glucuronidase [Marinilabiliales bacterium]